MSPELAYLESLKNKLDTVTYKHVYDSIVQIPNKYVPSAILHINHYIDRVRINEGEKLFTNEQEVSYIHDPDVLSKYVDLGRSNAEHQAVFYGAIESLEIRQPRVVAYFETSKLFRNEEALEDNIVELFTMSRWRIITEMEVVEMIFGKDAQKNSNYARTSVAEQMRRLPNEETKKYCQEQGEIFSEQFARKDVGENESFKYKISSAYANYIWNRTSLKGITYPSVQSIYRGQNVALLPELVDKCLKLESVGVFKFERKNGYNLPVDCIKVVTDFGKDNMNFTYVDYVKGDHVP
ncbi:hypothetical protein [Pedobacter sp. BMA]|uniref:hypothetical protein n=1 Tax=Pedobacter sp. BMA TaxID=1663685 RepID=UPI000649ABDE|nr:hypothetical protein [Pedobacter sp. BMA]KLT64740.1 hypothetical protein AB669_13425 [Pedobacter sp. BMA]